MATETGAAAVATVTAAEAAAGNSGDKQQSIRNKQATINNMRQRWVEAAMEGGGRRR